jgi:hypothetical protein
VRAQGSAADGDLLSVTGAIFGNAVLEMPLRRAAFGRAVNVPRTPVRPVRGPGCLVL